jgi:hypothetical protein
MIDRQVLESAYAMNETISQEILYSASKVLDLTKQINELQKTLEEQKDFLRESSNGNKTDIDVPGVGKIIISKPRESSEKTILELVPDKIEKNHELKTVLLAKGIIKEVNQKTSAARASVTVKLNI